MCWRLISGLRMRAAASQAPAIMPARKPSPNLLSPSWVKPAAGAARPEIAGYPSVQQKVEAGRQADQ